MPLHGELLKLKKFTRAATVRRFLSEIFRVMKGGGTCRITCPDLEIYARAYVAGDDGLYDQVRDAFWPKGKKMPEESWVVKGNGGAFMTGIAKNFWGHRWIYDFENMRACLEETGFVEITQRQCGQSSHPRPAAMDKPERAYETLYVEATKPG